MLAIALTSLFPYGDFVRLLGGPCTFSLTQTLKLSPPLIGFIVTIALGNLFILSLVSLSHEVKRLHAVNIEISPKNILPVFIVLDIVLNLNFTLSLSTRQVNAELRKRLHSVWLKYVLRNKIKIYIPFKKTPHARCRNFGGQAYWVCGGDSSATRVR